MNNPISLTRSGRNLLNLGAALFLAFPLFLSSPSGVQASTSDLAAREAAWIAEAAYEGILKVSKETGELMLQIPGAGRMDALAVSGEEPGVLWAYGQNSLSAYSFAGELLLTLVVDALDDDSDDDESEEDDDETSPHLAVSQDRSVWLARGARLHHFDAVGNGLHVISVGESIEALSVDRERNHLWVATKERLEAYNALGELTMSVTPGGDPEHRDIAYDPALDALWVADRRTLRRYDAADGAVLFSQELSEEISYLAPDYQGGVWIASEDDDDDDEGYLLKLDAAGLEQLRLGPYSEEIVEVVSEPADSSVWVASRDAVQHIGVTGEILHDVDLGGSREDDDDDSDDESEFDVRALALFIQLNRLPVADTGDDVNALTNVSVQLDGSQSYDPEGSLITFSWLVAAPLGSSAALHDATHPLPRLTPDVAGDYLVELIVNDGESDSAPSQVTVSVSDEVAPPNARAGRDQPVLLGSGVVLDGSTSDDPNDFPLSFAWSLLQVPTGSTLTDADIGLSDTPRPEFVPDVEGTYGLNLRVDNGVLVDDDAVQVLVSGPNVAPIAEAGPRRATQTNQLVSLDGSGSFDPDTGPGVLTHSWSLVARPLGSTLTSADIVDSDQPIARFTPDVEGTYVVRIDVDDGESQDGNNTSIVADDTPPKVTVVSPDDGAVIETTKPTIVVEFTDAETGIDLDAFQLLINGADVTAATTVNEGSAIYTPLVDLPGGDNEVTVRVADNAGNLGEDVNVFTASIFSAIADCGPTFGTAPHTVTYRSRGLFTDGSIVRYRWDLDGNGSYDTFDTVPRDYTYTFTSSGTYNAVLEVQNNFGEIATDVCTITVEQEGPSVAATASPSNGPVPLEVTFICQGQSPNGAIVLWEWDFEGDGTYDYSSDASGTTTRVYDTVGEFAARCRVTDVAGMTGVSGEINTTVRPRPPGSPSVTATASPTSGVAPLTVSFDGSVIDDGAIVLYEWDFDGDGVFDYSSTASATVSHTYQTAGIFAATLQVTDDTGLSSLDAIAIDVAVSASLSIPDDTFLPDIGETVTVTTTLSGTVPARVLIQDGRGIRVRTLVDETRAAGTYNDVWDGRNDNGDLLPDGDYYAILEYEVGGDTERIDLTYTTGGLRYNPPRSRLPSRFDPYENDPLPITFTVPSNQGASEVLAFVGLFRTNTRLVTLLDREPFGVGTHTIYWDGLLPDGTFAVPPPGDTFLFGIWGYTLPNNAIYLSSAPTIANFAVQPTQHSPARDGSRPFQITFDLDKDADMDLSVENLATGGVVFSGRFPGFSAGTGKVLEWDGLNSNRFLPDKGEYRLALTAIDGSGGTSLTRYMLIRVFY